MIIARENRRALPVSRDGNTPLAFCAAAAILACLAVATLCLSPATALAKSGAYVFDEYGLLTDSQFEALEAQGESIAQDCQIGAYLLICSTMGGNYNPTGSERNSFAGSYYREKSLGVGSAKDGVLFVIAVDSRDYVTWGNGLPWTDALSQRGVDALEESVTSYLSDNDWYGGCQAYYREVGSQLRYYVAHGKAQEPLDLLDWGLRVVIVLLVPLLVAFGVVSRERAAMLTARQKTEAGDYLRPGSLVVTAARDQYLRTTHTVTPRHDDSGSGGGGGGWGGGGSSGGSGGGKF